MDNYYDFGRYLFDTEDLDPVYSMLTRAGLGETTLKKFLLAYWCYYSCGTAAKIVEFANFYEGLKEAFYNKWSRGMERRHFWGTQAWNTIQELEEWGDPVRVVDHMTQHMNSNDIFKAVQSHRGFGPWMGWKIADMSERVLRYEVDFSACTLMIYKDPVKGAAWIKFGDKEHPITEEELNVVVADMEDDFSNYLAPPHYDRPVNVQEIETVLCKYKAHCFGFYKLGKDTEDIGHGLKGSCDLGDHLLQHLPGHVPVEIYMGGKYV